MKQNTGAIAAYVAAALFTLSAAWIAAFVIFDDPDNEKDFWDSAAPYVVWNIAHIVAGIAVVFVVNALRKQAPSTLSNVAFGFAIAGAVASLAPWAMLWALLVAVAFLLVAIALRRVGRGVAGAVSLWDWAIPAAIPVAIIAYAVADVTNLDNGDSERPLLVIFVVLMLVYAATLAAVGRNQNAIRPDWAEPLHAA